VKWPFAKTEETLIGEFWTWFRGNAIRLHSLEPVRALTLIQEELAKVDPALVVALEPHDDGPWKLVISPDGIREKVGILQRLVAHCRDCENWRIVAFRQPAANPDLCIHIPGGFSCTVDDVHWVPHDRRGDLLDVTLYVNLPHNAPRDADGRVGFQLIDHYLGEHVLMTRLGAIEFRRGGGPPEARPLSAMRAYLS
jgi:hypothetical protein